MRRRRGWVAAIPAVLMVLHVIVYLVAMDRATAAPDFQLRLSHPPPIILPHPTPLTLQARMASPRLRDDLRAVVGDRPAQLVWTDRRRGDVSIHVPPLPTGNHVLTLRSEYMGGRRREAAIPIVVGPFGARDDWIEDGVTLHVTQELLDGGPGSERDLAHALVPILQQEVDEIIEEDVPNRFARHLKSVEVASLTLEIVQDGIRAEVVGVVNEDTTITASGLIVFLDLQQGRQPFDIADISVKTRIGKSIHDAVDEELEQFARTHRILKFIPFRTKIAKKYGHPRAMGMIQGYLKKTLPEDLKDPVVHYIEASLNPTAPIALDDETRVYFRWNRTPILEPGRHIVVHSDVRIEGARFRDSLVSPGWPISGDPAPEPRVTSTAGIGISTDVLNALLYRYWATGRLDGWIGDSTVLDEFNQSNILRIRAQDAHVALPPSVGPGARDVTTSLGFVLVDGLHRVDATAALQLTLDARWNVKKVDVDCTVDGFHLYCSRGVTLVTCYPELMQLARDQRMLDGSVNDLMELDLAGFSDALLYSGAESELRLRVDHMDVDLECGGVCADVTARF